MMGLQDAFQIIICDLYTFSLMLFETLPSYNGQCAIICYSFLCFIDGIGMIIRSKKPLLFDAIQRQQRSVGQVPHSEKNGTGLNAAKCYG